MNSSALDDCSEVRRPSRSSSRSSWRAGVHEIGCGLGDFGEFLRRRFPAADYSGSEIMPEFLAVCRRRFPAADFQLREEIVGFLSAELER